MMLQDLNEISTYQSEPTQDALAKFNKVLDYKATHPHATVWYYFSDMILMTDIDAAYLVLTSAPSCITGTSYLTNRMINY